MKNVALIGMPGAGKTTVGRALGRLLDMRFLDSDKELVGRTGVSIATIFEIEGEASFRRREAALIAELLEEEGIVLATGGGAILNADTCKVMREKALVIYLRATIDALLDRTQRDTSRPLLAAGSPREKLQALFEVREPLYQAAAHLTFDTGRQSPTKLASHIASIIRPRLDTAAGTSSP